MKLLTMIALVLGVLAIASTALSQDIGLTFDELGTKPCIDGHTELIPNHNLGELPSVNVYVGAWDLPELFGYEYWIESSDNTEIRSTVFYPDTAANFGIGLDVRVGTGVCFQAGSEQAGPDPAHIRLAKHTYSWFIVPTKDVLYCVHPVLRTGDPAPNYTECVDTPVPLPFGYHNVYGAQTLIPDACIIIIFDSEPPQICSEVVASEGRSWGALKAAY